MGKFIHTPYTVSVHELIHRPGAHREVELDFAVPEKLGEGLIAVAAGSPIHVELRLESVHEGILATGEVDVRAVGECGRCLDPIAEDLQVEFQELFAYSVEEAFDFNVHDDHVDCEPLIRDAVVLALPFQPVCRPDCAGLDSETGVKLAEPRALDPEESLDSRWAALREFGASEEPQS